MAYLAGDPQIVVARQLVEGAATSGQTVIPIPGGFTPGMVDVFVGGAALSFGDYNDTDGMTIQLAQPMSAGTQFRIVAYSPNTIAQPVAGQLAGFRNKIINGACMVAQRPAAAFTSGSGSGYGGVDRFKTMNGGAGGQFTQVQGSLGFNGPHKCIAQTVQTPLADLSGTNYWQGVTQTIEGFNCYDLYNGQPVTVSFLFYSQVGGQFSVALRNGTAVTYSCVKAFTAPAAQAIYVSLTFPALPFAPSIDNTAQMYLSIGAMNNGAYNTATVNSWVSGNYVCASGSTNWATSTTSQILVSNIQLESGSVATPFENRPYGLELALCQRYYYATPIVANNAVAVGQAQTTGAAYGFHKWTVPMRAAPAMAAPGPMYRLGGEVVGAPTFDSYDANGCVFHVAWSATAFVAGNAVMLLSAGSSPSSPCLIADADI